jgi:hypothetical protein
VSTGTAQPAIPIAPGAERSSAHAPRAPRRGLDRFDAGVLAAFALVSLWVLALDLWQVVVNGRVWTGTDGFFLTDQMQYVAWIRDAAHHGLASNLFVLRGTPADYFQPMIVIGGAIAALGVPAWLALLLWKPVAVVAVFYAIRAYARRTMTGRLGQRVVLVLGLFFGSVGVLGDMWLGFWSWGYPFGLLSIAAMVAALLAYDNSRRTGRRVWAAPALAALASSLHPWQGQTLIVIVVGAELLLRRDLRKRAPLAAATVVGAVLPLAYYLVLSRVDVSWHMARDASRHSFPWLGILISLAPLALPALLAYRTRPRTFLAAATRAWPLAAVGVCLLSATQLSGTPLHAFAGITLPLSVLAVEGVKRAGWHRIPRRNLVAALAVAALTIPATVYELAIAPESVDPSVGNANFITRDESHALGYLARNPEPGGVLTRFYLGSVVPGQTGRRTFVGTCIWSQPYCTPRAQVVQRLFDGMMPAADARAFVRSTGAKFVLSDCQSGGTLDKALTPISTTVARFGCARVYALDAPARPTGALS